MPRETALDELAPAEPQDLAMTRVRGRKLNAMPKVATILMEYDITVAAMACFELRAILLWAEAAVFGKVKDLTVTTVGGFELNARPIFEKMDLTVTIVACFELSAHWLAILQEYHLAVTTVACFELNAHWLAILKELDLFMARVACAELNARTSFLPTKNEYGLAVPPVACVEFNAHWLAILEELDLTMAKVARFVLRALVTPAVGAIESDLAGFRTRRNVLGTAMVASLIIEADQAVIRVPLQA